MKRILLVAVLCAACPACAASGYAPMPAVAYAPTPTFGLAGQSVLMQATARAMQSTQAALDAQVAEATAHAQATQDTLRFAQTAQAATDTAARNALALAQTAQAATQAAEQATATHAVQATQNALRAAQTQDAATLQAQATARRATATAVALDAVATLAAQKLKLELIERERASIFVQALFGALIIIGVVLLGWGGYHFVKRQARRNVIVETRAGTVLLHWSGDGIYQADVIRPALTAPSFRGDPFATSEDKAESITDDLPAPITSGGQLLGWIKDDAIGNDESNRRKMMKFLKRCIDVAGAESDRVPGFREMAWGAERWTQHTAMLADVLESKPGKGTYLVGEEYPNLWSLWQAVGDRRYIPHSAPTEAME